jgi:hypothetical protein
MEEVLVGTLSYEGYRADIFSTSIPGEFKLFYHDPSSKVIEEAQLTGISSYRQREAEILERLKQLSQGAKPSPVPDLGDPGEY